MLGKLLSARSKQVQVAPDGDNEIDSSFLEDLVRFLVGLQTSSSQKEELGLLDEVPTVNGVGQRLSLSHASTSVTSPFQIQGASVDYLKASAPNTSESFPSALGSLTLSLGEPKNAGFSGRGNKVADTCYSFWSGGALAVRNLQNFIYILLRHIPKLAPISYLTFRIQKILSKVHLIDFNANRRFLEKTEHFIGGFGKYPGDPPGTY